MNKTFLVICFISLQLLSLKLGSATVGLELLERTKVNFGEEAATSGPQHLHPSAAYQNPTPVDSVTDVDGNLYHIVKIGKQRWMQENLKTAHFRNGAAIAELEYSNDWPLTGSRLDHSETGYPAWCYYDRDKEHNYKYGKLYNWYALTDSQKVCPVGYHVPSEKEFFILSNFLDGQDKSGAHMKSVELWNEKENYADNTSGFSALPAGIRYRAGGFGGAGSDGTGFWSKSRDNRLTAWCLILYYGGSNVGLHNYDKRSGLSVRCIGN